jgi:hypothetical protein
MLFLNRCSGELLAFIDGHHVVLLTQGRTEKNIRSKNGLKERVKITYLELFSDNGAQNSLIKAPPNNARHKSVT